MANTDQSFQSLRVVLDAKLPNTAMVVVSSACGEDGQAELACGLARAFSDSGRKTALISLYSTGDARSRCMTDLDLRTFSGHFFQAPLTPIELDSLVADVRAEHEVVMVASPPIITESASLHLCHIADGVLLAVRLGRKVTADDENTVTQLQRVAATLLGVIAVRPPAERATESPDITVARDKDLETSSMLRAPTWIAAALRSPILARHWFIDRVNARNGEAGHVSLGMFRLWPSRSFNRSCESSPPPTTEPFPLPELHQAPPIPMEIPTLPLPPYYTNLLDECDRSARAG